MKSLEKLNNALVGFSVKRERAFAAMLVLLIAMVPTMALAGAIADPAAQDFGQIWLVLIDWTQGVLGRIIALVMILVGIVMGVARQSIMAFVMGPVAGMGLFYAPDVIEGIMGASMLS